MFGALALNSLVGCGGGSGGASAGGGSTAGAQSSGASAAVFSSFGLGNGAVEPRPT